MIIKFIGKIYFLVKSKEVMPAPLLAGLARVGLSQGLKSGAMKGLFRGSSKGLFGSSRGLFGKKSFSTSLFNNNSVLNRVQQNPREAGMGLGFSASAIICCFILCSITFFAWNYYQQEQSRKRGGKK